MSGVERKTVEAISVFVGVSLVQYFVHPLDSIVLPCCLTYWWVSTDQHHWVVDQLTDKTVLLMDKAAQYWKSVGQKKEEDQTPK